ncbi:GATA-type zinc finger protein 1 isoform X2 [Notolabrus celidotus]|nr:GATA-type zinc finger protein 1 isoform X2 [Notolabrus celidotus]XP_034544752.1 GATA-type zinc finger protein 1 isoform X2 [Notolabrus celidotus]XP_034544753.1 GATA-type zinc finger protein 1 isoform X2 [Notolabrus celidotus]
MSTGPRTQAAFIQGNQSTVDQDAPQSALLYLFQEVSRLASPIHNSFLYSPSTSTWPDETSREGPFMAKEDAHSFNISSSSCQHNVSCLSNYKQTEKVTRESHSSKDTALVNQHPECNSPWKVLSLINLQCERLLNHGDVEESDQSSVSPATKLDNSINNALTQTDQGGNVLNEKQNIPSGVVHGKDVRGDRGADGCKLRCCVKDSQMGCCVQSQTAENPDTLRSELVEGEMPASSQSQLKDTKEERFSASGQLRWNQECNNCFSSKGNILNILVTENTSPSKLSFDSKEETSKILSKPALTLDHNANLVFTTELQSNTQLPPLSVDLSATQSASLLLNKAENYHSLSNQDDKFTSSKPDCSSAPSEDTSPPVSPLRASSYSGETNPLHSATPELKSRLVHQEEFALHPAKKWRTKTPRKQRHPSKSVDIQDPDFQGVTFRMDTEVDDTKEQCRLLITSKYSKEFRKSVRNPD